MITTIYGDYEYGVTYYSVDEIIDRLIKGRRVITNIPLNRDAVGAYVKKKRGRFDASRLVLLNDAELCRSSWDARFRSKKASIVIRETPNLSDNKYYNSLPFASLQHRHNAQDWLFCVYDCDASFSRNCLLHCNYAIRVLQTLSRRGNRRGLELFRGAFQFNVGFYEGVSYGRYNFFEPEICELIPSVEVKN